MGLYITCTIMYDAVLEIFVIVLRENIPHLSFQESQYRLHKDPVKAMKATVIYSYGNEE